MVNQMDNSKTSKYGLISWKLNKKSLDFLWKRHYRENVIKSDENKWKSEDSNTINVAPCKPQNNTTNKIQHGFFGNIKKHFAIRKAKQKANKSITSDYLNETQQIISMFDNERPTKSSNDIDTPVVERCLPSADTDNSLTTVIQNTTDENKVNCNTQFSSPLNCETDIYSEGETKNLEVLNRECDTKDKIHINSSLESPALQTTDERQIVQHTSNTDTESDMAINDESKLKACLTEELLKLSKYGWYWGPISGNQADLKLMSEPDGAFLVRDSSDDRYLLTLSFKSSGKLLHARMEHSRGLFSLCNRGESKSFTSIAALIDYSMNFSESAVICYSRPKYPGCPSFPVRLTKPVSRFTQVKSLQYLCRFVIRQNTRLDNIHKLPLPKSMRGYIEEAHY
ncbi:PREDICTED: uncharacterized protein LOC107070848 [Polistes dominula]|uniref:Uncharacterized protein LOC107070848 n=1 Tax=Polistes dominula TaxID=743375 RepID=A0ABM1IXE2_POLDO|nr:PREDICTED: uncharacterized protein LOC107070848 [Polistes dominula]